MGWSQPGRKTHRLEPCLHVSVRVCISIHISVSICVCICISAKKCLSYATSWAVSMCLRVYALHTYTICMCVHKNNFHSMERSCVQSSVLWTNAGSTGTEPAHVLLWSVGNHSENCHHFRADSWTDRVVYVPCLFCFWKMGCTHHLCHLFLFMAVTPTETASIGSSSFSSSSSSNNLEDTDAILFQVYARNHCQYCTCTPKAKSSTHAFLHTSLWAQGDTRCACTYA